jgi:hypothetical protein
MGKWVIMACCSIMYKKNNNGLNKLIHLDPNESNILIEFAILEECCDPEPSVMITTSGL